ncbi:hypothetical protein [Nonomuraea typhae]|uniref:hypothetical protein n=1 Tax=Nonomuraea typhae TaxID=2603600 RepID=UPI0012F8FAE9|nr:hypothetical protein [Nonomuraea typhae]
MITAVRTLAAAALATVALAVSVPAANASSSGYWTCSDGDYVFISDGWGYNVYGDGCVGQGSGDGPIILTSGYWAGSYYCLDTRVWGGGFVQGMHCVPF